MERVEQPAGDGQKIVVYVSDDTGSAIDPVALSATVAADAAALWAAGWRIVATSIAPLRQTGTAGNILFQSGGQYATQAAAIVTYARS